MIGLENINPFLQYEIFKNKKRYARSRNRVEAGIEYHGYENVKVITLTTKAGNDNSWDGMLLDLKRMCEYIRRFRKSKFEYTFVPEYTPVRGLLHMHGVVWCSEELDNEKVSAWWSRYHMGAWMVDVQDIKRKEGLKKYVVKHMMKANTKELAGRRRIIYSRGWLPKGWAEVRKNLVQETIDKIGFGIKIELEKSLWSQMNERYLQYCRSKGKDKNVGIVYSRG